MIISDNRFFGNLLRFDEPPTPLGKFTTRDTLTVGLSGGVDKMRMKVSISVVTLDTVAICTCFSLIAQLDTTL